MAGPVRLGIIGVGRFGQFLMSAYTEMDEVEVVGICNRDEGKLKRIARKYGIKRVFTDYRKFLGSDDIDIIVIATPPFMHARIAIDAMKAGKHVMCEKPLAMSMKEAEKIRGALKSSGNLLTVDFVFRKNPLVEALKKIARSRVLGDVQNVSLQNYANDSSLKEDHWFWDKKKSGGIWVEHGVHFFDMVRNITGKGMIKAESFSVRRRDGIEDHVAALCMYDGGMPAVFTHSFTKPYDIETTRFTVSFDKGTAVIKGWIPQELQIDGLVTGKESKALLKALRGSGDISVSAKRFSGSTKGRGLTYRPAEMISCRSVIRDSKEAVYRESVKGVMRELARAVSGKGKMSFGFEDGYDSLKDALLAENNNAFTGRLKR
ncbi:MAG: hypothetical protein DRO99_04420 [Candidatus Aenigmatarchaeota archaeon]|nr:MAG: hypothetical protein DRO99_04420 [Candidatus Aenigmarchaeota archaeon]